MTYGEQIHHLLDAIDRWTGLGEDDLDELLLPDPDYTPPPERSAEEIDRLFNPSSSVWVALPEIPSEYHTVRYWPRKKEIPAGWYIVDDFGTTHHAEYSVIIKRERGAK
jgi:hypothetical protein